MNRSIFVLFSVFLMVSGATAMESPQFAEAQAAIIGFILDQSPPKFDSALIHVASLQSMGQLTDEEIASLMEIINNRQQTEAPSDVPMEDAAPAGSSGIISGKAKASHSEFFDLLDNFKKQLTTLERIAKNSDTDLLEHTAELTQLTTQMNDIEKQLLAQGESEGRAIQTAREFKLRLVNLKDELADRVRKLIQKHLANAKFIDDLAQIECFLTKHAQAISPCALESLKQQIMIAQQELSAAIQKEKELRAAAEQEESKTQECALQLYNQACEAANNSKTDEAVFWCGEILACVRDLSGRDQNYFTGRVNAILERIRRR